MSDRTWRSCRTLAAGAICALMAMAPATHAEYCSDDAPDIELGMDDLGLGTVEVFYLSDFDPSNSGAHPILFRFSMINTGIDDRTLTLSFEVESGEGQLVRGESDPFVLGAGESKWGTNQQLTDAGHELQLGSYDISGAGDELEDAVTQTGYLPDGEYLFRLALIEEGAGELEYCTLSAYISNPRTLELTFPGGPFGENLPMESSMLPQFQWESRSSRFNFRLFPVLPGDGSGEEVIENQPVFENLDFSTGFTGTHSYLYPPSAEMLAQGESYCWQVEAIVSTSSGEVIFPSEIYCFEMVSGASLTPYDDMLQTLMLLLPPGMLDEILPQLQGFHSTGEITVDGFTISSDELPLLLQTLLSQGWDVDDLEVQP